MSEINKAVQEAIDANLSSEVAGRLKDFIAEAELSKTLLKETKKELKEIIELYRTLENLNRNYDDVNTRFKAVVAQENDLKTQEEILKIREEHAKERVGEIRGLVNTVFQSNRLNYNFNMQQSDYNSATGGTETKTTTGVITKDT